MIRLSKRMGGWSPSDITDLPFRVFVDFLSIVEKK